MRLPLFRRREIWLPTLVGWVVMLAIGVASCLLVWYQIHDFLSPNAPVQGAKILVVEGWLPEEALDQAVVAFRKGRYERVVTTGGPFEFWPCLLGKTNYAELAADYLRTHGLEHVDVTAVPAPASLQERTYLSAVKIREWLGKHPPEIAALDVFSGGTHSRRTHMLYRMAFGSKMDVGILSARPSEYDETRWWETSAGAKSVMGEVISLAWTVCCFSPPAKGSHEELWGVAQPAVAVDQLR